MSEQTKVNQVPIPEEWLVGHTALAREVAHNKALAHFNDMIAEVYSRKAALAKKAHNVAAWAENGRLAIDHRAKAAIANQYAEGNGREWVVQPEHWDAFCVLVTDEGFEMDMRITLKDDEALDEDGDSDE